MESCASSTNKRPCFLEENLGLALLADMEAGFSGQNNNHYQQGFVSKSMGGYAISIRSSFRSLPGSSPRSGRFYDARYEDHYPHFLEACHLCKKVLQNRDIFMYRGDTPFCSEECRQEQIDMDEAKEKNRNLSSSMKAMRNKEQRESTSPNQTQGYSCVTGTVAAAS
ncbi:hypothetical protein K1719_031032 [Acacia pycnantha]|nr:hypothetical protein K1719_031032 [Acacia pycnantha]